MCLPDKSVQPSWETRSILGLGVLMLFACLAGPAIAGAIGALGFGLLVGVGGIIFALALCAAVPAAALAWLRRSAGRRPTPLPLEDNGRRFEWTAERGVPRVDAGSDRVH